VKSPQKQQISVTLKAHQILSKFDEKSLMKMVSSILFDENLMKI
jgi:hypothetical protein